MLKTFLLPTFRDILLPCCCISAIVYSYTCYQTVVSVLWKGLDQAYFFLEFIASILLLRLICLLYFGNNIN